MLKKIKELTPIIMVLNNAVVWLIVHLSGLDTDKSSKTAVSGGEIHKFVNSLQKLYWNCEALRKVIRGLLRSLR